MTRCPDLDDEDSFGGFYVEAEPEIDESDEGEFWDVDEEEA